MTGYIYAIRAGDRVKIGYSAEPAVRFNKIKADSPLPVRLMGVTPGDLTAEAALHQRFVEYRIHGEWFLLKGAVAEWVCSLDDPDLRAPLPAAEPVVRPAPPPANGTMLQPATFIIDRCGGVSRVAKVLGLDVSRIVRFRMPREKGGTGGLIPAKHQAALLQHAKDAGIDLTPADFFVTEDAA